MKKKFLSACFLGFLICQTCFSFAAESSLFKKRVLNDLDTIHHIFEVKYAPLKWKEEFAGWNLDKEIAKAKTRISDKKTINLKDCHVVLKDFFNSTRDYHAGIHFYSTETASLPFLIKGSGGRYFISYVDRDQITNREFPFEEGDEILKFDGRPIDQVVQELRVAEFGENVLETDQSLAELSLTHRRGDLGNVVPKGKVTILGKKRIGSAKEFEVTLSWSYTPEKIQDFSRLNMLVGKDLRPRPLKNSGFFEKFMVAHFWDRSYVGSFLGPNKHVLGARSSFLPLLGQRIWKASSDDIFDAYIFRSPSGKNIGYIRIPHYIGDEEEIEEFGQLMNVFEKRCEALVIDQLNNPGGSVFYLYGLAATLANKPLYAPKHHIAMTQEEVYTAAQYIPLLEQVTDDITAQAVLGENIGGYPVDFEFATLMRQFCNFLVNEWERGQLYTDTTHLFGVNMVKPHPYYRFSKPVLVLINGLDFSGGDFFPAILQDNKRAVLFGTRTSGAGGYVAPASFPNQSGIKHFSLTGSLAERIDLKPIENLGVKPDIYCPFTVRDLQENYKDYVAELLKTVESMIQSP